MRLLQALAGNGTLTGLHMSGNAGSADAHGFLQTRGERRGEDGEESGKSREVSSEGQARERAEAEQSRTGAASQPRYRFEQCYVWCWRVVEASVWARTIESVL